ncbi:MAG: hypothetical protein WD847_12575 [Pirellulales bacterium]
MLVEPVKYALEAMDRRFVELSGLIFDPYTDDLLRRLGESEEKLLERPYAYEFYHQMRSLWDSRAGIIAPFADVVIQGEVDKGYQAIRDLDRIPDFLLHRPNSNERNFGVIEVKLATFAQNIERDFDKFVSFRNRRGYEHFVEIVIGHSRELAAANLAQFNQQGRHVVEISLVLFDTDRWRATDLRITRLNPEAGQE